MKLNALVVSIAVVGLMAFALSAPVWAGEAPSGPYAPTFESLKTHKPAPDWFRDAKFGIYFHWGVYSVPAFGNEWYPRSMHIKDSGEYKHHVETYGDPAEFGYHDFVPMFKAEHFDAEEWADLFQKAGARFAGPVAEHHDGFSMWASKLTPWNAKDKGPMRDITGELAEAIHGRGMKLVTTFHHARNSQHQIGRDGNYIWTGHYPRVEGWPTVSEDPELRMLYGNIPRDQFLEMWKGKLIEVIDNYQPDLIYFDSWLNEIPEKYRNEFLAYYFSRSVEWGKDVLVTYKQKDLPREVGVEDLEKGRMDHLTTDYTWLTDDTVSYGSWCYTHDLKIKPAVEVLHVLIDIVSKNGQLMLNVSPKADGTIPDEQRAVLLSMGDWLRKHGEAIYETRPFLDYGEGPTDMGKGGHFVKAGITYTAQDIRYTRKGDTVYAIALGWPGAGGEVLMKAFAKKGVAKGVEVKGITMLGHDGAIEWKRTRKGLAIVCPDTKTDDMAVVFKLDTEGLPPAK